MLIIPAIDIKESKCVRLHQGQMDTAHIYYEDPTQCAEHWIRQGAQRLHLVDLDAAVTAKKTNRPLLDKLIRHIRHRVQVQVGGGIRTKTVAIDYLENCQAHYIIISTWALRDPKAVYELALAFPQRIYLGLDVKDGHVYGHGWTQASALTVETVLAPFKHAPLAGLIMTNIDRDGTLQGLQLQPLMRMRAVTNFPIIAAGGLRALEDVIALKEAGAAEGLICGKSLYEKTLDLKQALQLAAG